MKSVFLIGLLLVASVSRADETHSCKLHPKKGSECDVVKVWTRCDVEKQKLRNRIVQLERRVKELESQKTTNTVIEKTVVTKKVVVEKEVIKHHILGLYAARDVSSAGVNQSNGTATGTVQTAYEPGLKYQYQFNFGLVPEVGINIKGNPMVGLGFEF